MDEREIPICGGSLDRRSKRPRGRSETVEKPEQHASTSQVSSSFQACFKLVSSSAMGPPSVPLSCPHPGSPLHPAGSRGGFPKHLRHANRVLDRCRGYTLSANSKRDALFWPAFRLAQTGWRRKFGGNERLEFSHGVVAGGGVTRGLTVWCGASGLENRDCQGQHHADGGVVDGGIRRSHEPGCR
jgi:hypothetical protein